MKLSIHSAGAEIFQLPIIDWKNRYLTMFDVPVKYYNQGYQFYFIDAENKSYPIIDRPGESLLVSWWDIRWWRLSVMKQHNKLNK